MRGEAGGAPADPIVLTVDGVVDRAAIPALCARLRALLASDDGGHGAVICDVGRLAANDIAVVDALARLQLTARRHGRHLRLRHASAELRALLSLTGLALVLPLEPAASGQVRRQAEEREEARGVEEEGDAGDPPLS